MDVTTAYMYSVGSLPQMFEAIQKAGVPPRFTHDFLVNLGFKSSNDRSFVNVLKGLGFVDSNAVPTATYREYRDKGVAPRLLARQIRTAYQGLFLVDENAQNLTAEAVKGRLSSITGKDESVVKKMASTFVALCKLADFKQPLPQDTKVEEQEQEEKVESPALEEVTRKLPQSLAFSHVIYINLPTTRDVGVYDAIFKSIREHLQ